MHSGGASGLAPQFATLVSAASLLNITDDTTYTLTVAVAYRGIGHSDGTISLLAGGTSVASISTGSLTTTFTDFSTSFTTAPSGDLRVGLPLTVELRVNGITDFELEAEFDNVRVDASPAAAPEPGAGMLVCAALGVFGARRNRSAKR